MSGDSEEGREPRKDSAGDAKTSIGETGEPILLESNQNNATIQTEGISTSLPASMGMGGGYVPMITDKCLNSWDVQSKHIQSENGVAEALYSGECRGGGGESYVLSFANNQPVAYGICSYDSNSMKSDNPKSGIYEADTSRTLDLNGGSPACNQGGIAVVQCADMYNGNLTGNVAATLNATSGDSPTHSGPSVCILNDQGGERMNCSNGVTSTLRAEEHGHQPIVCLEGNGSRPSHQGDGYKESDVCYTLNSTEHHAVCIENHPHDSRVKVSDDGIVQTLNGRMGTGGGNVPMIMEKADEK